jgi:hypothetical protein
MKRKSDQKDMTVFRTDRFFLSDRQWFFTTREGGNLGPFATHAEAEDALVQYLMDMGIPATEKGSWDTPGAHN